jgi:SAM-dependent methyltransferase
MQKVTDRDVRQEPANGLKEFFKRWPSLYYFIFDFLSPVYFGGLSPVAFLDKYPRTGQCLNLGSGARRLAPGVLNVDIESYDGVDIVADITNLSFQDASVARIISDQVLEHVHDPEQVVSEIYRVLESGGYAYVSTPFMYPFHASPSDYRRWTHEGLRYLLHDFEILELGVRCGPFSTLTTQLCYLLGSLFSFGNERLYWMIVYASGIPLFPLKCLDIFGNHLPFALHMASVPYCVVRKGNTK